MKKLKASKDLFAIFYIVNWILSIIIAPLGSYAVIVLMLSTIEFLSSGKTSILMHFMMFGMIFKFVVLIYLFIYLILSLRSLIQIIKTSKDSLHLAPISLILTLLLQLFPFISALKDTRTMEPYRWLIGVVPLCSILSFLSYLYARYGLKGQRKKALLWAGHVVNGVLILLMIVAFFQPIIPQLTRTSRVLSSLEQEYKKRGMDAKVETVPSGYGEEDSNNPDFNDIYPIGKFKVTIGKHSFYEEVRVNKAGGIEEAAFIDPKTTPSPILRVILQKENSQENLIKTKENVEKSLDNIDESVNIIPHYGNTEVSVEYITNPKRSKPKSFEEKDFKLNSLFDITDEKLLEKEDVWISIRIELNLKQRLFASDSGEKFLHDMDYSLFQTGNYVFEIEETDKDNVTSKKQFFAKVKDGKLVQLNKNDSDQDLTEGSVSLLEYSYRGSIGYSIDEGYDHMVDWPD